MSVSIESTRAIDLQRQRRLIEATAAISIRPVRSLADLKQVLRLRHVNYGCFHSAFGALDELDLAQNCLILVAEIQDLGIVGTLRLLDGSGRVELDTFISVNAIPALAPRSFVEATRLTIRRCRHIEAIKLLLCKAHWLYTLSSGRELLLMSSTSRLAGFYRTMRCSDVGPQGEYRHSVLRGALHRTFCLSAPKALDEYREARHSYYEFMASKHHDICFE